MRRLRLLKYAAVLASAPLLIVATLPFVTTAAEATSLSALKLAANSRIAPGVYARKLTFKNASGTQRGALVTADLTVPGVSFVPNVSVSGQVGTTQSVTKTVTTQKAIAGINADQFVPATGIPLGGVIANGNLLKSPFNIRKASSVYVQQDGTVHVGILKFGGTATLLTPSATAPYPTPTPTPTDSASPAPTPAPTDTTSSTPSPAPSSSSTAPTTNPTALSYPITSINTPDDANAGKLTMFTSALRSVTLSNCVTATGTWAPTTGTLTIWGLWGKSTTVGRLASTDRTLAGCGDAGVWLATNLKLGSQLNLTYGVTTAAGLPITSMISSAGMIVKAGVGYSDPAAIQTSGLNPESAMCVSQDGRQISLVAVDGRQGKKAPGVTIAQMRELLVSLKCYTGVILDGGGSTSLAVKPSGKATKLMNTPSGSGKERMVPDVILIKYKKP